MPTDNILGQLAGEGHTRPEVAKAKPAQPKLQHGQTDIQVIPYNASFHDDAHNFLPWLWGKLKEDGLISLYFPGEERAGFSNFVRLMSGDSKIVLVIGKKNDEPDKCVGFASWRSMPFGSTHAAMAGFIFFREFWDGKLTDIAARRIMEHWFDSEQMDLLIGCVADINHAANRFMERIGWTKVGTVPMAHIYDNKQCGSVIWQITKEAFKTR